MRQANALGIRSSGIYSAYDQPQSGLGLGGNYSAWLTALSPALGRFGDRFWLFRSVDCGASYICAGIFDTRYVEPLFAGSARYSGDFGGIFNLCRSEIVTFKAVRVIQMVGRSTHRPVDCRHDIALQPGCRYPNARGRSATGRYCVANVGTRCPR